MEKKWSTNSSVFLHMQHLFITITWRFLRLSKLRIFPRATDHKKKAALEGAWVRHTLPWKGSTYRTSQGVEKRLDPE